MGALIWRQTTISGEPVTFCSVGETRLYVKERASTVEAWKDSKKLGNFASVHLAQAAAAKSVGAAAPVVAIKKAPARPALARRVGQDPCEVGPPREMIVGKPGRKPPVRVDHEVKLHKYPLADLSEPPVIVTAPPEWIDEKMGIQPSAVKLGPAYCGCGAKLGRSGKCPALCEPLPKPAPAYTGPKIVGSTHLGRLAAPVDTSGPGWIA